MAEQQHAVYLVRSKQELRQLEESNRIRPVLYDMPQALYRLEQGEEIEFYVTRKEKTDT